MEDKLLQKISKRDRKLVNNIVKKIGLSHTRDWNLSYCLNIIEYVPTTHLNFYLSSRSGWTDDWLRAAEQELTEENSSR